MATRCGVREKDLLLQLQLVEDESANVVSVEVIKNTSTYKVMAVSDHKDYENLSFDEAMSGFFECFEHMSDFTDQSDTVKIADEVTYVLKSNKEKSPLKRRRVL